VGEEISIPSPDPENSRKNVDAEGADTGAPSASAAGEITLDTGGTGATSSQPKDQMSIGPYLLVRKLGEGGMGQVWLAEQTVPVKRSVAVKLIKGGVYDSAVIQRFESERQSLAVMNHPAIAKIFDAGSTKDGQPFFVMEYVDGLPITRYCDSKKLKIRQRLELFIQVCEGVQHAHQRAIIHRDLKPSNVLVVDVDGKPMPRIIDFGIAKAISSQANSDQTMFTRAGVLVGTPGFMSPEQADPRVPDVDTRTDVYSLGVILYVLLTGTLPFDLDDSKKKPFDEVLRQLREEDPPSPSTKLREEKETSTDSALKRATEPRQLVNMLRGDLDWITMKALEKDRARRYGSPSELAADIARYLEDRPVMARPASTGYRLGKYVRRHRLAVSAAVVIALLLSGFTVAQAVQLRKITQERDRTARERDRANRVTDFMTAMFKQSDPSKARGSVTARELLDQASKDIDTGLAKDPALQAQMMDVMGTIYFNLELFSQAHPLLQRAVEIRRNTLGLNDRQTLGSMFGFLSVLVLEGRYAEAEKLGRETLDVQRRVLGESDADTLRTQSKLAIVLLNQARYPEAEKLQRETLEKQRRILGPEVKDTLVTMLGLAMTLHRENQFAESMKLYGQLLEIEPRVFGPDNPATQIMMKHMSEALYDSGRYAEAETLQRRLLETARRLYGPESSLTMTAEADLARNLFQTGRFAEAEKILREVLDFRTRTLGPEAQRTLAVTIDLAFVIGEQGRWKEAEKLQRNGLQIAERTLGPNDRVTLIFMGQLARSFGDGGQFNEAEKLLQRARGIQLAVLGHDHADTASTNYSLACIEARMGRHSEALALLREAVDHGLAPRSDLDIEKDSDLKSLHADPRFAALVAYAKERAAAAQKPN
jgi:eukaryotic-like serine/threonine-protein kinase